MVTADKVYIYLHVVANASQGMADKRSTQRDAWE